MPDRHGPYRGTRYILEIEDVAIAGFSRALLPTNRSDVVEYREGTDPPTPRKLRGLNRYGPLVLETGVALDTIELYEWRELVERGSVDAARRDVAVVLLDEEGEAGPRWELTRAWPAKYVAPDLDATGCEVAVERLEIAHEGAERTA